MDRGAWRAIAHGVTKSWTSESLSDFSCGSEEKESAFSAGAAGDVGLIPGLGRSPTPVFLPGESPWIEEHGGLQFMGSQRVRHD